MNYSVILFLSSNYSIWSAKVLKKEGIERKMIPVPRHLSSDCGYCVRVKSEDVSEALKLLKENNIEYDRIEDL